MFKDSTFTRSAGFTRVSFNGDAWFERASFDRDAWFERASFNDNAQFQHASFDYACFPGASFNSDASFAGASFRNARFERASFSRHARFTDATFSEVAHFDSVTVQRELHVSGAAKRVNLRGIRGDGRVDLRLRTAEVDFTDVVLAGPVSVLSLGHPVQGIDETAFADETAEVPPVRVKSMQGLDASLVTLTDVDLSQCQFAGMHRVDQLLLDGQCLFADGPARRRRVLAEEHHWRAVAGGGWLRHASGWRRLLEDDYYGGRVELVGPARLEVLYRQLRKALEDAKNEPGAADFYYGEMEMRRLAATRRAERWLLGLYWAAVSGYGLRTRRALAWLALLIVLSIGGLTWFGFPQTATFQKISGDMATSSVRQPITMTIRKTDAVKPLPDRAEKATEVTLNTVIFRNPDADLTTAGRYLNLAVRILGPVLLGLAILAVRNQVKR